MTIKEQLRREIELRGKLKGEDKQTLKQIAKEADVDYNGFREWYNDDRRSMGDRNIQKIVDVLNKRFVLIDKNQ